MNVKWQRFNLLETVFRPVRLEAECSFRKKNGTNWSPRKTRTFVANKTAGADEKRAEEAEARRNRGTLQYLEFQSTASSVYRALQARER